MQSEAWGSALSDVLSTLICPTREGAEVGSNVGSQVGLPGRGVGLVVGIVVGIVVGMAARGCSSTSRTRSSFVTIILVGGIHESFLS